MVEITRTFTSLSAIKVRNYFQMCTLVLGQRATELASLLCAGSHALQELNETAEDATSMLIFAENVHNIQL
jgi:hypothetical protein